MSPILAVHELPQLGEVIPTEAREFDKVKVSFETHQQPYALNTLFNQRRTPLSENVTKKSCVFTVSLTQYCYLRTLLRHLFPSNATKDNVSDTKRVHHTYSTPVPKQTENATGEGNYKEIFSFATYSLSQCNENTLHPTGLKISTADQRSGRQFARRAVAT